jgi:dTDP-4-dehydrorhamnose reductase
LDVRNTASVDELVRGVQPDVVIHTAAMTDVDDCERNPGQAWSINVDGTRNIVDACQKVNSYIVFLSSSFVFSGDDYEYEESDDREPINKYGESKKAAEDVVRELPKHIIVRTDQPYTLPEPWQGDTMISWTLSQLKSKEKIDVFYDWYNNPILVEDLVSVFVDLIIKNETGTFHVAGPEFISRYLWAKRIALAFTGSDSKVQPTQSSSSDIPARRPNVRLNSCKVRHVSSVNIRDTKSGASYLATQRETK